MQAVAHVLTDLTTEPWVIWLAATVSNTRPRSIGKLTFVTGMRSCQPSRYWLQVHHRSQHCNNANETRWHSC